MSLALIVAMDLNGGIGKDGAIPWRCPQDIRRFKGLTQGHAIIMGRKTLESIGRPLQSRTMVVLTKNKAYTCPYAKVVHSMDAAMEAARGQKQFIIGGGGIYRAFLPIVEEIHLSTVLNVYDCDTFFPRMPNDVTQRLWRWDVPAFFEGHTPGEPSHTYMRGIHIKEGSLWPT